MARAIVLLISSTLMSVAQSAPSIVSINLCADQLVLNVAAAEQILSLSWLAADPEESMLAERARGYPPNYGTAEEVLRFSPDVVVAGKYTNVYTKALLSRLGFRVVEIDTARSLADVESNLRRIGEAAERPDAAEAAIDELRQRVRRHTESLHRQIDAAVIRPGGFTIEPGSLALELLSLAGIRDLPSRSGLDAWGSLSVETLLRADPELLIIGDYKSDAASLANAWLRHPAIANVAQAKQTVRLPIRYWACGIPQSLDSVDALRAAIAEAE